MRGLSLFSGIGGLDLAFEWVGGTVMAMCEIEPYCQQVLKKHWPDVPLFEDIHDLTGDKVISALRNPKYKEVVADEGTFAKPTVDIIYGGFPC